MVVCQDVNDEGCSKSLPNKTWDAHVLFWRFSRYVKNNTKFNLSLMNKYMGI